jgi:sortase (surface protein transpeptidase)
MALLTSFVIACGASGSGVPGSGDTSAEPQTTPATYAFPTAPPSSATSVTAGGADATSSPTAGPSSTTTIYVHPILDPVRVVIPAIGVDATILKVGVQSDGNMEVPPFGYAGWFRVGPAPGEPGPAVVVAHVDTKKGPDVFYRLDELKPGDVVQISNENGDTATFVVDWSELVPKTDLPTKRIWENTPDPVIRLITCGGEFDRSTGHYKSNTIVYAHLVD